MLYKISLNVARRVVFLPLASRSILARQFSSAPTVALPAKSAAATQSTNSTTKSTTKPKAESTTKTAAKKKVATKPKPKDTKPKKAAAKKPATYTSDQLKVPTRPIMSGYIMFATEQRTKLGAPATLQASQDVTRECAQKWKALGEDEKEVYRVKALEFKEKAGKAYDEWVNNLDPKVLRAINMKRRAAGKLRVRRRPSPDDVRGPLPPFLKFYTEFKAENPSLPVRVTSSQAAVAWHALSPEARKQYSDSYQADKKAFLLEKSTSHTSQQSV